MKTTKNVVAVKVQKINASTIAVNTLTEKKILNYIAENYGTGLDWVSQGATLILHGIKGINALMQDNMLTCAY